MTKRDVVARALAFEEVPYVPWSLGFTTEARQKLVAHYGQEDLDGVLQNHLHSIGSGNGQMVRVKSDRAQDVFGVVWDRSRDKDIGVVANRVLPEPTLAGWSPPDPADRGLFWEGLEQQIAWGPDRYRVYMIGFSLYERAWTLRGMENLLMDFLEHPDFAHALLGALADFNIALVRRAVAYDIDAVYFGDDWGQQQGLQMGYPLWKEFLYPHLARQYAAVREAGKKVFIHSCGDVDELFDDLVAIGLDCFNPFQPEVMDVPALMGQYHGKLAFHGGLSTQRTLPYGSPDEVRAATQRLIDLGRRGGYILSPAHAVEGDVPIENMVALIDTLRAQPGWQ